MTVHRECALKGFATAMKSGPLMGIAATSMESSAAQASGETAVIWMGSVELARTFAVLENAR